MSNNTTLTRILQGILFLLFTSWLVLFIINPVRMAPDSYGYIADSKNLFDPSYQTMRPVLFPFFLLILNGLHLKMSITALSSTFLFLASLGIRPFRPKMLSSIILLAVSVVSFIVSLGYNRSKSQENEWSSCPSYVMSPNFVLTRPVSR
ncbi:MAG TPA: hypothetical protein VGN00_07750 [Puia sp.]|jgi:hypothetical protein